MKTAAVSLFLLILLAIPGVALAKVPWSSVEIEPDRPVAGEPMILVVRFWGDPSHTQPVDGMPERISLELQGAGGELPVTLDRLGQGAYRAEVTPSEGRWRLVAAYDFGEVTGQDGVEIATLSVAPAPIGTAPLAAAAFGAALVTAGAVWRARRSSPAR
jgi:hypothetical protein